MFTTVADGPRSNPPTKGSPHWTCQLDTHQSRQVGGSNCPSACLWSSLSFLLNLCNIGNILPVCAPANLDLSKPIHFIVHLSIQLFSVFNVNLFFTDNFSRSCHLSAWIIKGKNCKRMVLNCTVSEPGDCQKRFTRHFHDHSNTILTWPWKFISYFAISTQILFIRKYTHTYSYSWVRWGHMEWVLSVWNDGTNYCSSC